MAWLSLNARALGDLQRFLISETFLLLIRHILRSVSITFYAYVDRERLESYSETYGLATIEESPLTTPKPEMVSSTTLPRHGSTNLIAEYFKFIVFVLLFATAAIW